MTKIIFLFKVFILYLFFFSNSYAKSSTSFFEQGKELFEKKKYDESKIFFQRDIVFNPKNERSYLYLAKIFEENDNVEEEEIKLNNVLLLNSTNDEALYMMILLKIKKSDYHSARSLIEKFNLVCNSFCSKKSEIDEKFSKLIPDNDKN
tara:strand:- start:586 stop:1032 length:447 start_codon:yes stop_codon:yes gene_type:complete